MRVLAAVLILVAIPSVAALPGATSSDGPVPVTLFLHGQGYQDMVLAPQPPPDDVVAMGDSGFATHTACVDEARPATSAASQSHHTYYARVAGQGISYEDGRLRQHHPIGIGSDLELVGDSVMLSVTFRSQALGGDGALTMPAPSVIPNVVVRGTLREGDEISVGHVALNEGTLLAEGATEAATLAGDMSTGPVTYREVDGEHLYTFQVPMSIQETHVSQRESFNLRIDILMDNPYCNDTDGTIMPDLLQFYNSPVDRPRLEMVVADALHIQDLRPRFMDDALLIHASVSSPWGLSELPPGTNATTFSTLRIDGPAEVSPIVIDDETARCHDCYGHGQDWFDMTMLWQGIDDIPAGRYDIQWTFTNLQQTDNITLDFFFEVGDERRLCTEDAAGQTCIQDGNKEEAIPGLPVGLLLLGALLLAARRR